METSERIDKLLVNIFNVVLKMEEKALMSSSTHDLSLNEMHTLAAIGSEPLSGRGARPKTMTQVAAMLKIKVSTLTTSVNRLVRKGYVSRSRAQRDGRIVLLRLTKAGRDAVEEHRAYHKKFIAETLALLDPQEQELLARSLERINEFVSMQQTPPIRDPESFRAKPLRIGNVVVPVPVFQGGMSIGVSLGGLAGAVAKEGAAGCVAAAECGFAEEDYEENRTEANIRVLEREIKKAKKISATGTPGPVAANIPYTTEKYADYVDAAINAGADMIVTGAGVPTSLPGIAEGRNVALVPVISSPRGARVIMKNWKKKYGRIPDAFIFEGPFSGGTLGYSEEKIDIAREEFYANIAETKQELDAAGGCPLIVGGGIRTLQDAQKAYAYGADGVQIGTRFVTTEECDAPEGFRKAYLDAGEDDVALVEGDGGKPCWAVRNAYVRKLESGGEPLPLTEAALITAGGDLENGIIMCGRDCWKNDRIEKVADIIAEFTV
ncbi:MAG: nitronate monooxygenase [Anaerovoracaceae bacterium]|jgi:nitronate monooxygenase